MPSANVFRHPETVRQLADALHAEVQEPLRVMEVCGTHTMSIARFGLRQLLPANLTLVSGPGCPVCVTAQADLDWALALAQLDNVTVASFGDLLRVPGSNGSLAEQRAAGADVRVVYSILDAIELAARLPQRQVVFVAVGFETTAPGIAAAVRSARQRKITNFTVLSLLKTMPEAMRVLLDDDAQVDGFLLPGHVCAITGLQPFDFIAKDFGKSAVVSGFEPVEILGGLLKLAQCKQPTVANVYTRTVRDEGNPVAQELLKTLLVPCDAHWRGLGLIPASGLALAPEWREYDAAQRFAIASPAPYVPKGCQCGEILRGRLRPHQCGQFGRQCSPESPLGPCMVSSEGPCAAAFRYGI